MSMIKPKDIVYNDGRTKQSFKNGTDISRILARAHKTGVISHLNKYGAIYGDFTDMPDLLEANQRLARGKQVFDELPSEVRKEFHGSVGEFFSFVNDPANVDDLLSKLPALAEPGRQHRIFDPAISAGIEEAVAAGMATNPSSEGAGEDPAIKEPAEGS